MMVIKLVAFLLISLIMLFMYTYQFFAPKITSNIAHGFTLFFLVTFFSATFFNLVMVLHRYKRRGKLCSRTNCVFTLNMIIIFGVSLALGSKI
jgi:hypothetical protein